jgi:hypothetical protein
MAQLHTVKITDYQSLFSVSQTLDSWQKKTLSFRKNDPNNRVLGSSESTIESLRKDVKTTFPAWQMGLRYSLFGRVFVNAVKELYIAYDESNKIQGIAITDKAMDKSNVIYSRELIWIATNPDNIPATPTQNKVASVGKALLFHIATEIEKESPTIQLCLRYEQSAKGFYEKMGFSCIPYSDTGIIEGGKAIWPVVSRRSFLQRKHMSTIELTEPVLQPQESVTLQDKKVFEKSLFAIGKKSIIESFEKGWYRSYQKITFEEAQKLLPRIKSLFCIQYGDLFTEKEKIKILPRLTYIATKSKNKSMPELIDFAPVKMNDFIRQQMKRVGERIKQALLRVILKKL